MYNYYKGEKAEQIKQDAYYERDEVGHGDNMSNCCGSPIYDDTDICSRCKEHCEPMEENNV